MKESSFVSEAILDLDKSLIVKCKLWPCVVNPLTVSVQNSSKKRLILELHIPKQSVKYDDLHIALSYLQKGFYMIKFDITSAYHFIEIFEPHTECLGFSWVNTSGETTYYEFLVFPFCLSCALIFGLK